jgi:hypothetical protein
MPGTRKMTDAELERALDYLMHQASDDIERCYEIDVLLGGNPTALVTTLRRIAHRCSRVANHIEDL